MIDNIIVVSPPGYIHSQAFFDLAMGFSYSLRSLGHPAIVTTDGTVTGKSIVFGAHLIPEMGGFIDGSYILFNSEQLYDGSPWVTPGYIEILKNNEVWDYSHNNIDWLKLHHGIDAKFCEIGYHPVMSNIKNYRSATITGKDQPKVDYVDSGLGLGVGMFDVLFYGSLNDRRKKIIEDLRAEGLNTVTINGYGAYRDKYIRNAKIVLNLHYYDTAIFEIFRCSHLMANAKCVVSETGLDETLEERYADGVVFTSCEGVVGRCKMLINDESARKSQEEKAIRCISRSSQAEILKGML